MRLPARSFGNLYVCDGVFGAFTISVPKWGGINEEISRDWE